MNAPTHLEYHIELHGWRKFWARLRRRPWSWVFEAEVEFDPIPQRTEDGQIGYTFKAVTPLTKRVVA